jgi:excisionase family DNA binding protein
MGDDEVLTVDDVADYLKLHKQTVSRMAQRGELPGVLIAKRWRFKRSDVEAMLNTTKVDNSDNYQNHPSDKPMPLANVIDAPSDLVGVTVISEEDGQA